MLCASILYELVTFWKVTNPCRKMLKIFWTTWKVTNPCRMLVQKISKSLLLKCHQFMKNACALYMCKHSIWIGNFSKNFKGQFLKCDQFMSNTYPFHFLALLRIWIIVKYNHFMLAASIQHWLLFTKCKITT